MPCPASYLDMQKKEAMAGGERITVAAASATREKK
jgi:hypothetical protein